MSVLPKTVKCEYSAESSHVFQKCCRLRNNFSPKHQTSEGKLWSFNGAYLKKKKKKKKKRVKVNNSSIQEGVVSFI